MFNIFKKLFSREKIEEKPFAYVLQYFDNSEICNKCDDIRPFVELFINRSTTEAEDKEICILVEDTKEANDDWNYTELYEVIVDYLKKHKIKILKIEVIDFAL